MRTYTIIGGVNGVGKSSFTGILKEQRSDLGILIDVVKITAELGGNTLAGDKAALKKIRDCIDRGISFTQETTLSGRHTEATARELVEKGYRVRLYYIGLDSAEESVSRIANRVKRGGHDIPTQDVERRFAGRWEAVAKVLPYCDEAEFYDNDNGFVLVAEYRNGELRTVGNIDPMWLKELREYLDTDIEATFEGDPAANSKHEIVLSYPGILATAIYRLAHGLQRLNVPLIPRMMTEYSHTKTGVDIHPGAKIGKYFCIDHATGVVVGSTSVIGEHVKIYQGVTIGALSTKDGQKMHGTKRHPTIEDYVTLYSGASVLGGRTVIGEGAVIGGNAFVTKSVDPYTTVTIKTHELVVDRKSHKKTDEKELEQDDSLI